MSAIARRTLLDGNFSGHSDCGPGCFFVLSSIAVNDTRRLGEDFNHC